MTLIECFDQAPVENIAACLRLKPEKLIFVGNADRMRGSLRNYRELLKARGLRTQIQLHDVDGHDFHTLTQTLTQIVSEEDTCVIDVTGGEDTVLMAVGALTAGLTPDQRGKVSVQRFNLYTGEIADCDGDGLVWQGRTATLTVEELITLHGGTIHPKEAQLPTHYHTRDIEALWQIMCEAPWEWNDAITVFMEIEKRSLSGSQVYLLLDQLESSVGNYHGKMKQMRSLLDKLQDKGIIRDYSQGNVMRYQYTDPLYQYCTQKAGNLLEVKALLEARELLDNGRPYFDDCMGTVSIDWDGKPHKRTENIPDTRNEVDVILVRGMVPLFVSCKNGKIEDAELYKLQAVSQQFGRKYSKTLLLATSLEKYPKASVRAVEQRAKDMGISLVTNAAKMSRQDWKQTLKDAMELP